MEQLLETTAWRFVIGEVRKDELPAIATDALVRGVDSPSLRELAGLSRGEGAEAAELFEAALRELEIDVPSEDEALWRLARHTAERVVSGELPPYDGALYIWRALSNRVEEEGDLRIFVGLASEREGHPESAAEIDAHIVQAARELLARDAPRQWLRIQARQGESPLSRWRPDRLESVPAHELDISPDLRDAIEEWRAEYDATFDSTGNSLGFETQAEAEAFVQRGQSLVAELQAQLGGDWRVEFMPEPIRQPGLRLRLRNSE